MSLPASGIESLYRNSIKEVARFFDEKHPQSYKVYNLCNERNYNPKYFHGNVVRYPIHDHNVPELSTMFKFARDSHNFLSQSPYNVIAVHCKGGKGRTGCMVSAYLLYSGIESTSTGALDLFASKRTSGDIKNQGVSGPSQIRFVEYFEELLEDLYDKYETTDNLINMKDNEFEDLLNTRYNKEIILERIKINFV